MSIYATMYVKLFTNECFVSLEQSLLCFFCSVEKLQNRKTEPFQSERQSKHCKLSTHQHSMVLKSLQFCLQVLKNH